MALHTTFQVGGPADFLLKARNAQDIQAAVKAAAEADAPCWIIGCGSNVLVADEGLRGLVVQIGPDMASIEVDGEFIRAQAGATNEQDAFRYCHNFTHREIEISAAEADWGYRHSMMMDAGYIVLEATLHLAPADPREIRAKMDDLRERRTSKQPLELPSAGSTFKRPTGYFAGKLIQDAGMRGHRVGGAMVSEKHCGFVVNAGGATAADVLGVIHDVQAAVLADAGVSLEPEVRMWGF